MNGYVIKRNIVSLTGFLKWKWKHIPPGLYVLNFHRIGNPDTTPFDPNVFSGNEGQFAEHIKVITSRFRVISIRELLNIMDLSMTLSEPVAMITFGPMAVRISSKVAPEAIIFQHRAVITKSIRVVIMAMTPSMPMAATTK